MQSLDISNNCISDISILASLVNLKCLYASSNKITSLQGLDSLTQLLEVDLSYNELATRKDIAMLNVNSSIVVVSIECNPVLDQFIRSQIGFAFNPLEEFPKDYSEISPGLYFRNPENLRKLKSSRYRNIIKHYKNQEKYASQLASPDWGYSKSYSNISYDMAEDNQICSFDEKDIVQGEEVLKTYFKDIKDSDDELHAKKTVAIAKLDLKKISNKPNTEKSSTKPDSSLEGMFEELICYCKIEDTAERYFSFSSEKYEHAVNILKARSDERKELIESNLQLVSANKELEVKYNKILEERNSLQENFVQLKNDFKAQEEFLAKIIAGQGSCEIGRSGEYANFVSFPTEISEKSREIEDMAIRNNYSFESSMSSFAHLPEISILSTEYQQSFNNSEYLVDKRVGLYIQKLLKKISSLVAKNKHLRDTNKELVRRKGSNLLTMKK